MPLTKTGTSIYSAKSSTFGETPRRLAHITFATRRLAHVVSAPRKLAHLVFTPRRLAHVVSAPRKLAHLAFTPRRLANKTSIPQKLMFSKNTHALFLTQKCKLKKVDTFLKN